MLTDLQVSRKCSVFLLLMHSFRGTRGYFEIMSSLVTYKEQCTVPNSCIHILYCKSHYCANITKTHKAGNVLYEKCKLKAEAGGKL